MRCFPVRLGWPGWNSFKLTLQGMMMPLAIKVLRSCVLIAFVCLALLYLNNALYKLWLAGGPPTPHPIGWLRSAFGYFCFSAASMLLGMGLYRIIPRFKHPDRLGIALATTGLLLFATPFIARFVLVDICLDRGGSWNKLTIQCSDE